MVNYVISDTEINHNGSFLGSNKSVLKRTNLDQI